MLQLDDLRVETERRQQQQQHLVQRRVGLCCTAYVPALYCSLMAWASKRSDGSSSEKHHAQRRVRLQRREQRGRTLRLLGCQSHVWADQGRSGQISRGMGDLRPPSVAQFSHTSCQRSFTHSALRLSRSKRVRCVKVAAATRQERRAQTRTAFCV